MLPEELERKRQDREAETIRALISDILRIRRAKEDK